MLYDFYRQFPPGLRAAGTQYSPYFDPITQRLGLLAQLGIFPARLQPMVSLLEDALGEVHRGELDPRAASAMASLAGALVRTITAGELEERLRALEDRGGGKVSP